jgi:hypothetical protein
VAAIPVSAWPLMLTVLGGLAEFEREFIRVRYATRSTDEPDLPILDCDWGFRQTRHLPRFTPAAIPVNVPIAESGEVEGKIAALVSLRVEASSYDRHDLIAASQLLYLTRQSLLILV